MGFRRDLAAPAWNATCDRCATSYTITCVTRDRLTRRGDAYLLRRKASRRHVGQGSATWPRIRALLGQATLTTAPRIIAAFYTVYEADLPRCGPLDLYGRNMRLQLTAAGAREPPHSFDLFDGALPSNLYRLSCADRRT